MRKTILPKYDPPDASHHLVMFGDSVGGGTGASHPDHSIAGLLAQEFPKVRVTNKSIVSGVGLRGLYEILKNETGTYDVIVLSVGGLDVIRMTPSKDYQGLLENVYTEAKRIGTHVVHVLPANVGLAPVFRSPLNLFYERRARVFHRIAQEAAQEASICYVDMFHEKHEDPFRGNREYYAADLSHPSDKGYCIWGGRIAKEIEPLIYGK